MTPPTPRRAFTPLYLLLSAGFSALGILVFVAIAGVMRGGAAPVSHGAPWALAIHIGTVVPALFLGAAVLVMKKGTRLHKLLGRIWAGLMMTTALASFGLTGLTGGIGPIHIFSVITLVSIPRAIWAIRRGNIVAHQRAMMGPYLGLLVAGLFAFTPGRYLGNMVQSLF
ncbi:MAG: hypothetical protein RLZZ58_1292 [Pseudomonadota bacterium]